MKRSEKYDILSALSEELIRAFERKNINIKNLKGFPERPPLPKLALSKNICLNQPNLITFFLMVPSAILISIAMPMLLFGAGTLLPGLLISFAAAIMIGSAIDNHISMKNYALGPEKELARIKIFLDNPNSSKIKSFVFEEVSKNKALCEDLERLCESENKSNFFTRQFRKHFPADDTLKKFLNESLKEIKKHSESQTTPPESQTIDQLVTTRKDRVTPTLIKRYGKENIEAEMLKQQNISSLDR